MARYRMCSSLHMQIENGSCDETRLNLSLVVHGMITQSQDTGSDVIRLFFMLYSTEHEHEISIAHRNIKKC